MNLSTAQQLALAVLQGDQDAALALADAVQEAYSGQAKRLPAVQRITASSDRLRLVFFIKDDVATTDADLLSLDNAIRAWLRGESQLYLKNVERMEMYELPGQPVAATTRLGQPVRQLADPDYERLTRDQRPKRT